MEEPRAPRPAPATRARLLQTRAFMSAPTLPASAQSASLLRTLRFSICQHAAQPPNGIGWLHEIKHDGHRVAVITDGRGGAVLRSRNGYDVTHRFGAAIRGLGAFGRAVVLDGEIAAPDAQGVTHLDGLNEALDGRSPERLALFRLRSPAPRRPRSQQLPARACRRRRRAACPQCRMRLLPPYGATRIRPRRLHLNVGTRNPTHSSTFADEVSTRSSQCTSSARSSSVSLQASSPSF